MRPFFRNSPYLSQFDGDSWIDLEEQENRISEEKLKEEEIKRLAPLTEQTAQMMRVRKKKQKQKGTQYLSPETQVFDMSIGDTLNDIEMATAEQLEEFNAKQNQMKNIVQNHLGNVEPDDALMSEEEPEAQPRNRGRPLKPKGILKEPITKKSSKKSSKQQQENQVVFQQPIPMVVNDEDTQEKRKIEDPQMVKTTKKSKKEFKNIKAKPLDAELKIEREEKKNRQQSIRKSRGKKTAGSDSDVEVGQITMNSNKTMKYWKEQSANELRNQLKLRDIQKFKDEWAFKDKTQLLEIIRQLIRDNKW